MRDGNLSSTNPRKHFDQKANPGTYELYTKSRLPATRESMTELRPYQTDCSQSVETGWLEYKKQLIVLPTGGGKTLIFSHLCAGNNGHSLILAHREELIDQAVEKLHRSTGILAEVEKAERYASLNAKVVVGSVQTLRGRRLEKWPQNHFKLIVVDEAHHALADSYQSLLAYFNQANVLGVTATPDRGDKRNLGQYFENVAYEITLIDLIRQGYLSPIQCKSLPIQINLNHVRSVAGDFALDDLGGVVEPFLKKIAHAIQEHASNRKVLVFLPLIHTSEIFTKICQDMGLKACHIDGKSENRKAILEAYAKGEFNILSNAMLLTEGFDEPTIDCIVILRPTKSRALYSQMVGRGTRTAPNKSNLLLLDFLWMHERHNLIQPAHLIAPSEEIARQMMLKIQERAKYGEEVDLETVQTETIRDREEKLARELRQKANRKARSIDPIEFGLALHDEALQEYEPTMGWHEQPVSQGQAKMLANFGFDPGTVKNKGHASAIIDRILNRRKLGFCTPKQLIYLRKMGYSNPDTATFEEASAFLNAKWKKDPLIPA